MDGKCIIGTQHGRLAASRTSEGSAAAKFFHRSTWAMGSFQMESDSERIKLCQDRARDDGNHVGRPAGCRRRRSPPLWTSRPVKPASGRWLEVWVLRINNPAVAWQPGQHWAKLQKLPRKRAEK